MYLDYKVKEKLINYLILIINYYSKNEYNYNMWFVWFGLIFYNKIHKSNQIKKNM